MPLTAFPSRYRAKSGNNPPISPGVLSPLEDSGLPSLNYKSADAQAQENQTPNTFGPEIPRQPRSPKLFDTKASAEISTPREISPRAGDRSHFSGLKKLKPMPAPGLKRHAAGDIITEPEVGIVGEDGPEEIVPLNPNANQEQPVEQPTELPPLDPTKEAESTNFSGLKEMGNEEEAPNPNPEPAPIPAMPPASNAAPVTPTHAVNPPLPGTEDSGPKRPLPAASASAPAPGVSTQNILDTSKQLEEARKNMPAAPKNNWASRLGMAILSMTKFAPVANQIIHPKWTEQMGAYQRNITGLEQAQKEAETAANTQALVEQREAQAAYRGAQAEQQANVHEERLQRVKEQATAAFLKAMGPDAYQIPPGSKEELPEGFHVWTAPNGDTYARPGGAIPLPPELLPMFPGSNAGDLKTRAEYNKGLEQFRKDQAAINLEHAKADDKTEKTPTISDTLLGIRATGKNTGNPTIDAMSPQEAHRAIEIHKTNPNITVNYGAGGGADDLASMVATYQVPWENAISRMNPSARSQFAKQVNDLNPDYLASNYHTFQNTEKAATTGRMADQARSLNTMMGHLGVLDQAVDALGNGNIQALNRLANFVGAQTGQTPITTYEAIVHRIGPEITKAYVAGGGTAQERGTNEADFDPKLGVNQLKQNVGISARLAGSLVNSLQDQYQRGTYGRGKQQFLSDEAKAVMDKTSGRVKLGDGSGKTVTVKDPRGVVHTFPDQASADRFKKAAGIK